MLLLLASHVSQADTRSIDSLWQLVDEQKAVSGRFAQQIYGTDGELMEDSSGYYAVLRPSFFRWQIELPDKQLIVVNEDEFWHYDIDLATATRRTVDDAQAFTPLELLASRSDALKTRFQVELPATGGYRLLPQYPGASFTSLDIVWSEGNIKSLRIDDRSGQRIELTLEPETDIPLTPAFFEFQPPAEVDVFDSADL